MGSFQYSSHCPSRKKLGGKNFQSNSNSLKIAQLNLNTSKFIILSRFCISSILLECKVSFFSKFLLPPFKWNLSRFLPPFQKLEAFFKRFFEWRKNVWLFVAFKTGVSTRHFAAQPGVNFINILITTFCTKARKWFVQLFSHSSLAL